MKAGSDLSIWEFLREKPKTALLFFGAVYSGLVAYLLGFGVPAMLGFMPGTPTEPTSWGLFLPVNILQLLLIWKLDWQLWRGALVVGLFWSGLWLTVVVALSHFSADGLKASLMLFAFCALPGFVLRHFAARCGLRDFGRSRLAP